MTQCKKIREAYIKVYGDRWKEYFVKHYWKVIEGNQCEDCICISDKSMGL